MSGDARLPAPDFLRAGYLRASTLGIVLLGEGFVEKLALAAGELDHHPGDPSHRILLRVADVDGVPLSTLHEANGALLEIANVLDAPVLGAVAVDGEQPPRERLLRQGRPYYQTYESRSYYSNTGLFQGPLPTMPAYSSPGILACAHHLTRGMRRSAFCLACSSLLPQQADSEVQHWSGSQRVVRASA